MSKIPVSALYKYCEIMLHDTWGYIYGTAGEMWSAEKQAKYKAKYADDSKRAMSCKYGGKWAGHMVTDCSGVMVYIWGKYNKHIYHGSNTIRRQYCGDLRKKPSPGYAAFKVDGTDYHHIGIVAADGLNVYEAKGTQAGFVMSAASSWNCFAPFNDVDYTGEEVQPMPQRDPIYQAKVTTDGGTLRVRSGPNTNTKVIGQLDNGSIINVYDETGNWAETEYNGEIGYCSIKYLTKIADQPDEPTPQDPDPTSGGIWVYIPCANADQANLIAAMFNGRVVT